MKKIQFALVFLIFLSRCSKEKYFDGPDYFSDVFESYSATNDLFLPDDELWSFTQITKEGNYFELDSSHVHSGNRALKFFAGKSTQEIVSKCSISKQNMAFWEGETVEVSAWYYLSDTETYEWLFLFDLEEQTTIGAGPGMRLALVNNQLRIEYKFYEKDIIQEAGSEVDFPRNQWVEIKWQVHLSQKNKGFVKLWQDGQLIIDSNHNTTLPKDILYSLQGTKGMYSSVEVGITANSKDNDLTLWVDDVEFKKVN